MNNVLGIIAEYNPFHNGHLYHLNEAKRITNSEYSVAIMSGNFTQRGDVSLIDKWSKTKMALAGGIDLVIELPVLYAVSSAENFADGAIKILNSLNVIDYIAFGSECGDITVLADVLIKEPKDYKTLLSHELSKGVSFPKARENALMMYLNDVRRFANILSHPNNILGIEYLKALRKRESFIRPITIKRKDANHSDSIFSSSSRYASGSSIRSFCNSPDITDLQRVIPEFSYNLLEENFKKGNIVKSISNFDKEIIYTLRKMSIQEISELPDVSEGLEYSLKNAANSCNSIIELLNLLDSKRYTKTRIQRILLYALLQIYKRDMQISKSVNNPYIRILGFNSKGREILSEISKRNPKLNLVTSVKKFFDDAPSKNQKLMLEKDIWASNVYTLSFEYESKANLDFTEKLITI